MVKPTVAVEIVARDKSDAGFKSAERRGDQFAKKSNKIARESGLGRLGQQIDGLTKFRTLNLGFDGLGRSLSTVGHGASAVNDNVSLMTRNVLSFGGAATGVFGRVAAGAGVMAGALAGTAATIGLLAAGAYVFGEKWAKLGAGVGRDAEDFGVSAQDLQARRAAGARFGVTEDQTDASIEGLGSTLYDAKSGANNLALGALSQMKVQLKQDADGRIDVMGAMDDIADAIARQKDPMVQRKLASIFGMSGMLPALRKGSGALKAEGQDYLASGAAFTDDEIRRSAETAKNAERLRQQLSKIEKTAGVKAMDTATAPIAAGGADALAKTTPAKLAESARGLADSGLEAGRRLVDGAKRAALALGQAEMAARQAEAGLPVTGREPAARGDFGSFRARIEHQESRGRQFRRKGVPLVSKAGAVGVMQVLPETGRRAAARAGVKWDEQRFYNDEAYNRQIGTLELQRLYKKYGGREVLAAAAYNAGEGRLDGPYKDRKGRMQKGWLERFGDPRKGEISDAEFAARIPFDETRDYAKKTAVAPAKAEVTINLKNAPPGTTTTTRGGPGVNVAMNVQRSLEGP